MHMDDHSGKRAVNGTAFKSKGLRDAPNDRDENIQFCPRIGCSGRLNYTRIGCTTKPYSSRPNLNTSNGKEVVASSLRTPSLMPVSRKLRQEYHRKASSQIKTDQLEDRTFQDESVVQEKVEPSSTSETGFRKSAVFEVGCSSGLSAIKTQEKYCNKSRHPNQNNLRGNGVFSTSSNTRSGTRIPNAVENGSKNPKCSSVSDVVPQSSQSRFMKKRSSEGESSSSSVGNRMSRTFTRGGRALLNNRPSSKDGRALLNNHGILISESRCSSRRWGPSEDNNHAVSDRIRRSCNINSRLRTNDQYNGNSSTTHTQSSGLISQLSRPQTPNTNMLNSPYQFSTDTSSSESSSYSVTDNDGNNIPGGLPFPSAEFDITQSSNHDALWRYSMDEIAGVLLQLERIEQEDLRYEQLIALETNLFLNGMSFYDQHRDMRLDIDDMSYEELLALGERMGTVSTALSEEAMSKCLRRSIYQVGSLKLGLKGNEDDNKCSICQEEYAVGDEVGMLKCEHRYHLVCVRQWLSMKNWCPICKASAVPSQASSPP